MFRVVSSSGSFPASRSAASTYGRRGFCVTTERWFLGDAAMHRRWLSVCGVLARLRTGAGLGLRDLMLHPAKFSSAGRWWFQFCASGPVPASLVEIGDLYLSGSISLGEMFGIQAAIHGQVHDPVPF